MDLVTVGWDIIYKSAVRLRRDRQDGGAVGPSPFARLGRGSVRGEDRRYFSDEGTTVESLQQPCLRMLRARVWVEQRTGGSHCQQVCLQRRRLQRPARDLQRSGGYRRSAATRQGGASLGYRTEGGVARRQDGEMGGKGPDSVGVCGYIQYQIRWDIKCTYMEFI